MRTALIAFLLLLTLFSTTQGEETYAELVRHFDYDRGAPLGVKEIGVELRAGVKVYDLTYASPRGGQVPAYLVVPPGPGPFPAVLYGHWAMPNSPMRNRTEFLEEAVALADAGVVSLLPDAPFARPGFVEDPDILGEKQADAFQQQVIDLRRGVDLLLARKEVDPQRIAYVGHSYNASVGGILTGVEKRIKAFVLMAGSLSDTQDAAADDPTMAGFRKQYGEERIKQYLATHRHLDPGNFVGHAAPAPVFLQYAFQEQFLNESRARRYFELVSQPKEIRFYDTGHALNAQARWDRIDWLSRQLGFRELDAAVLEKIREVQ